MATFLKAVATDNFKCEYMYVEFGVIPVIVGPVHSHTCSSMYMYPLFLKKKSKVFFWCWEVFQLQRKQILTNPKQELFAG